MRVWRRVARLFGGATALVLGILLVPSSASAAPIMRCGEWGGYGQERSQQVWSSPSGFTMLAIGLAAIIAFFVAVGTAGRGSGTAPSPVKE